MPAAVPLWDPVLPVSPGGSVEAELRVRNTGTIVDQLHIEVLGEAAEWATVIPATVSLFPDAEATVRLLFSPQAKPGGPSGRVPFGVRVRSKEHPEDSVVEEGVLDVAPITAVSAELVPRTSRGRRQAGHSMAIDNKGTRPVNATVTAFDPDHLLAFAINPTTVVAEPNTASFVKVKVRPKKAFRTGPPKTHPFQVVVEEGGQQVAVADGMMMQEAIEPKWLRKAALFALLGLVLLAGLWFALLRPTVRSAAKEAAREEVTPPTIGPGPNPDPGPGPGPDPGPSPDPTPGPGSGQGGSIGGRLFLTEKGVTSYEVPGGFVLQLTDIVLQNPAGDTGPLEIRREGTPLLVVELGNFRDLDYHFVAPLVFTAGQKVELSAQCTSPSCTPGAYFAGFLVNA